MVCAIFDMHCVSFLRVESGVNCCLSYSAFVDTALGFV